MLSFDIRTLEQTAAQVDGWLAPDDPIWEEGDPMPAKPVHVTGRLSAAGSDRFYWTGRIEGTAEGSCRRCLEPVQTGVFEEVHLFFVDTADEEAEDPGVFQIPPHAKELDLRPAIREQWLLAVPAFAECSDDCKGLCAHCGTNLNTGSCDCSHEADSRWDALRALRGSAGGGGSA